MKAQRLMTRLNLIATQMSIIVLPVPQAGTESLTVNHVIEPRVLAHDNAVTSVPTHPLFRISDFIQEPQYLYFHKK